MSSATLRTATTVWTCTSTTPLLWGVTSTNNAHQKQVMTIDHRSIALEAKSRAGWHCNKLWPLPLGTSRSVSLLQWKLQASRGHYPDEREEALQANYPHASYTSLHLLHARKYQKYANMTCKYYHYSPIHWNILKKIQAILQCVESNFKQMLDTS